MFFYCMYWFFVIFFFFFFLLIPFFFFFQAEDGIRDAQESRGLGDVYKRQAQMLWAIGGINELLPQENQPLSLYTFDPADGPTRVDLGGRRIIKKKKKKT